MINITQYVCVCQLSAVYVIQYASISGAQQGCGMSYNTLYYANSKKPYNNYIHSFPFLHIWAENWMGLLVSDILDSYWHSL